MREVISPIPLQRQPSELGKGVGGSASESIRQATHDKGTVFSKARHLPQGSETL